MGSAGPAGLFYNPIEIFIDEANHITWNVTVEGHAFYPGIVERTIQQRADGLFHTNSYGGGNGSYPALNDEAAGILFGGITTVLP